MPTTLRAIRIPDELETAARQAYGVPNAPWAELVRYALANLAQCDPEPYKRLPQGAAAQKARAEGRNAA